jgi:mercuric ion transport protein
MTENRQAHRDVRARGWLAGGGILSGAFALLGASCCVLPVLLVNLGVSSALVANLAIFAHARELFVALTILLLAGGALLALRGGRRPVRGFWIACGAGLALLAAAMITPHFEPELLAWMRAP